MTGLRTAFIAVWIAVGANPVAAQQVPSLGLPVSEIVVVDTDELFRATLYGQRIASDLAARARELQVENDRITADLTAEEQSLTERRPQMDPVAFRAEAAEFDTRVQGIRRARDAAISAFETERDSAPRLFLEKVRTTLGELMVERGAVAMLDQRIVFLSLSTVDITKAAIARIDASLGDGAEQVPEQ
tara:strand:+ start:3899 stop:4462 length:564 start_codon:yes stop_codon:yes gene_type:complete